MHHFPLSLPTSRLKTEPQAERVLAFRFRSRGSYCPHLGTLCVGPDRIRQSSVTEDLTHSAQALESSVAFLRPPPPTTVAPAPGAFRDTLTIVSPGPEREMSCCSQNTLYTQITTHLKPLSRSNGATSPGNARALLVEAQPAPRAG